MPTVYKSIYNFKFEDSQYTVELGTAIINISVGRNYQGNIEEK